MIAALLLLAGYIVPGQAEAVAVLLQAIQFQPAAEAAQLDEFHAHLLRRLTCCCRLCKPLRPS